MKKSIFCNFYCRKLFKKFFLYKNKKRHFQDYYINCDWKKKIMKIGQVVFSLSFLPFENMVFGKTR